MIRSGSHDFSPKKYSDLGGQYLAFRVALINYRKVVPNIGRIYYEIVQFSAKSAQAGQRWGGWEAILLSFAKAHNIPCEGVHTGTVKIAATGRGDAPKDDAHRDRVNASRAEKNRKAYDGPTVLEAIRALGFDPKSGDECDSLAVLMHALAVEREEMNVQV